MYNRLCKARDAVNVANNTSQPTRRTVDILTDEVAMGGLKRLHIRYQDESLI